VEPRRGGGLEVDPGADRELDERDPGRVRARERSARHPVAGTLGAARLETRQLAAHVRAGLVLGGGIGPLWRAEEARPGERAEGPGEVHHGLGLLETHLRARDGVARRRQEWRRRVAFLEVLDDGRRVVQAEGAVLERRHLAVGMPLDVLRTLVLALLEAQEDG